MVTGSGRLADCIECEMSYAVRAIQLVRQIASCVVIMRFGFSEDFPELTTWFGNFQMDDQSLGTLEAMILDAGAGNERDAVEEWLEIEENRALVDSWLTD